MRFIKSQEGGSLLKKAINNLPFEMHLSGHNFTGPGTKLKKQLNPDLTPKKWSMRVNRVDKAAYHHDIFYLKNDYTATRNAARNKNMSKELEGICIYNPSLRERLDKSIVSKLIGMKVKFGMGVKKKLDLAEKLHKPIRRKFKKRRVLVNGIDRILAADLVKCKRFPSLRVIVVLNIFSLLLTSSPKTVG